jgi:hypothetical protein
MILKFYSMRGTPQSVSIADNVNILEDLTTIESACMCLFRLKYLPEEHVAIG